MASKADSGYSDKMKGGGVLNQKSADRSGRKSGNGALGGGGSPKHSSFKKGGKVKACCD